jgi:HEPN domain-containing protein
MADDERIQRTRQWFQLAILDLEGAKGAFSVEAYNIACFLSQQSVEKATKSLLAVRGEKIRREHAIAQLLPEDLDEQLFDLNPQKLDGYYLATRYPEAHDAGADVRRLFGRSFAQDAIATAEGTLSILREWIASVGVSVPEIPHWEPDQPERMHVSVGKINARVLDVQDTGLLVLHAGREKWIEPPVSPEQRPFLKQHIGKSMILHWQKDGSFNVCLNEKGISGFERVP